MGDRDVIHCRTMKTPSFFYENSYDKPNKVMPSYVRLCMSLADIFNVPVDYLLGRSAISFKLDKLNKSFFGKFTIIFF